MAGRNLIDIHQHFFTPDYLAALHDAGVGSVDGFPLPEWNLPGAIALMDANEIQTSVLSISAPGLSFAAPAKLATLARSVNEQLAKMVAQHPRRLGAFAILPLPDVDAALREIAYAYDTLKADGIVLFTNINDIYLGDKRLDPVFDELNRRDAVVFVHPVAPTGFDMARLGFPAPSVEYPFDTTRMIMNFIASGTRRRCPRVRMIVAHGGGALPILAPRAARHTARFARIAPPLTLDEVNAAFDSLYYDVTGVSHEHTIDAVVALAPRERLLFGTDHPFMMSNLIPPAIKVLDQSPSIDDATRAALSHGNALKLFPRIAAQFPS
jgi:predicted TIM-barrel fold metal-dependent hydrolase